MDITLEYKLTCVGHLNLIFDATKDCFGGKAVLNRKAIGRSENKGYEAILII